MTLRPEQEEVLKEAKEILDKWNMVYLALRPRFGKSLIAANLINDNSLFVTVKSAIEGVEKVLSAFNINCDVINYESLHKVKTKKYDYLILDEANKNISRFPKMSKSRKELERFIHSDIKIIWLSGTPSIESNAQLFHQLSISPRHSFRKYKNFYEWFFGSNHYKNNAKGLPGYGIEGIFKYTGGPRPVQDYSQIKPFSHKFKPIMITKAIEAAIRTQIRYLEAPDFISEYISSVMTSGVFTTPDGTFIADGGAAKLSKAHQLSGGTCISDLGDGIILSDFKAAHIAKQGHKNCCVFYKYIKEKELLSRFFPEKDLYQVDSNCLGIDLSHYDEMIIYSLTWSGQNFHQVKQRLVNVNRKTEPVIYIYLTTSGPDKKIYEAVSLKEDFNTKFLKD